MSQCFVYGLRDPRTAEIRYVGQSKAGMARPYDHSRASSLIEESPKNWWLRELFASGLEYEVAVLERCERSTINIAEAKWIEIGRAALGSRFTNRAAATRRRTENSKAGAVKLVSKFHEGRALLVELDARGCDRAALAKACGVSWTAVKKYVEADRLGAKAWETCRVGLLKLGLNPDRIRPPSAAEPDEDLKPELARFKDKDQLQALRHMLTAPEGTRRSLVDAIDGALLWAR